MTSLFEFLIWEAEQEEDDQYPPHCSYCDAEFRDKNRRDMPLGAEYANGQSWVCPECGRENV